MAGQITAMARSALCGSRAFSPLRVIYQCLFDREKLAFRRKMRRFYSEFVSRGDLVFDIGANVGMYSEVFSELGARVIAVEPDPRCHRMLTPARRIHLVDCAVGAQPGWAAMHICEDSSGSTLNPDWQQSSERSALHHDTLWLGVLTVEIITMDQLATTYGIPRFVKIDVEGYEDQVFKGMSFRPEVLSFESNRLLPGVAVRCLALDVFAKGYEFNLTRGMKMQMVSESWMGREELTDRLDALMGREEYADIIARRTGGNST